MGVGTDLMTSAGTQTYHPAPEKVRGLLTVSVKGSVHSNITVF